MLTYDQHRIGLQQLVQQRADAPKLRWKREMMLATMKESVDGKAKAMSAHHHRPPSAKPLTWGWRKRRSLPAAEPPEWMYLFVRPAPCKRIQAEAAAATAAMRASLCPIFKALEHLELVEYLKAIPMLPAAEPKVFMEELYV